MFDMFCHVSSSSSILAQKCFLVSVDGPSTASRHPRPLDCPSTIASVTKVVVSDSRDRVAAITVAQRPPVMQHPDPTLGSPRVCLSSAQTTRCADKSLDLGAVALLGRSNISMSSDPCSPPHHPAQRRLGFFPSSTATRGKASPLYTHLDHKVLLSHTHSRSESTAHKDILISAMSSTACSSAANKVHTSPSKVRFRRS